MSEVKRLERMPYSGGVVVAHPSEEAAAKGHALGSDLDYLLSDACPPGVVYVLDVDAFYSHEGD